ncbi:MAG TPA: type I methionyl aminopeptidase [Trueperaceae bacterium]
MCIDSPKDLMALERVGRVVRETLQALEASLKAGITTLELDQVAQGVFERHGARSAPALEYDFPGTVLISINDEAVHGIPGPRVILPDDLVKLDVTPELGGYVADAAVTVAMPEASAEAKKLASCANRALRNAIRAVRPGRPVNELGRVVEREVASCGFSVLRELGGHGVGRAIHEEPQIWNYYDKHAWQPLAEGMVFTIEPIIATGGSRIFTDRDGWTVRTRDGSLAAHFEHTIVVRQGKPLIVTA